MGIIALEGIEFFAYHGFYSEEQKVGNKYSVDIEVESNIEQAADNDNLSDTVNYELLYKIAKKEMKKPGKLLEHVANRIIEQIFTSYPGVDKVKVAVSKFNPPIGGICNKAKVTIEKLK
jgi:7,8-dihydroneopterin aldolase/epimerase/oxygenase